MKAKELTNLLVILALAASVFLPFWGAQAATYTAPPWAHIQETATGSGGYVTGPGTPPLGTGSFQMTVNNTGGYYVFAPLYAGTRFDTLTELSYNAYRSSVNAGNLLAVSLQLNVDYDLNDSTTTWQGRLVYEPYQTPGVSGTILQNTWYDWDALAGRWWMTGTPRVGDVIVAQACPQASPCTWAGVLAAYPNAGISSGVGFKVGSNWAGGFTGAVDNFRIGISGNTDTYDFEPLNDVYVDDSWAAVLPGIDPDGAGPATYMYGDAFPTINQGVAAVAPGGTVHVNAGLYPESVTIAKSLTITGAGQADDASTGSVMDGTGLGSVRGIFINTGITGVTIENLRVQDYTRTGIYANGQNDNFTVQDVTVYGNNLTNVDNGGGIYMNGPVDTVLIDGVTADNNRARGIVIWNGFKTNITITNNTVTNNNCCGIELQDGTASGVTMSNNTITGNADSGMSAIGLTSGDGPNVIANNIITNNGRFGIEIKLPNGTGLTSGDGSIVIENNTVSLDAGDTNTDLRDRAGIAVFRRAYLVGSGYVDIPTGVVVRNNTVTGYRQTQVASFSTGFGIVVEGANMQVLENNLDNNDVALQVQAGHLPYTANTNIDGNQANLDDDYFGRGNSPVACAVVTGNILGGANTIGFRQVGDVCTTLELTSSVNPSTITETVTFTATIQNAVAGGGSLPSGVVDFMEGANMLCDDVAVSGGQATCDYAFPSAGSYDITAYFIATLPQNSSEDTLTQEVNLYATTTTITADNPDPSKQNETVTVEVSVSNNFSGGPTPTGSVDVSSGALNCTAALTAGMGSCDLTFTTAGPYTITAEYAETGDFAASSDTEDHTVLPPVGTTTTLSSTPNPSTVNELVTLSVVVAPSKPGDPTPVGSVDILDGVTVLCDDLPLVAGEASCAHAFSASGIYDLSAEFTPTNVDDFEASSDASHLHTVNRYATSTTITADTPDPSDIGQTVTVSVQVSNNTLGGPVPTGSVDISSGALNCVATINGSGAGSCTLVFPTAGPVTITASYPQTGEFSASADTEAHTVGYLVATFKSISALDGFITQKPGANLGDKLRVELNALRVGDTGLQNLRDISIMSFNTAALPDNAIIQSVEVRLIMHRQVGNPAAFGPLYLDLAAPKFGPTRQLELADYHALATQSGISQLQRIGDSTSFQANFVTQAINRTGPTQFRLRFKLGTDKDFVSDYYTFFSGERVGFEPVLVVTYYFP